MPKAMFYEGSTIVEGAPDAEVRWATIGWNRADGSIQLGVGKGVGPNSDGSPVENPFEGSHYMTLDDRSAVNRMIRELRNARDAAFGKDA